MDLRLVGSKVGVSEHHLHVIEATLEHSWAPGSYVQACACSRLPGKLPVRGRPIGVFKKIENAPLDYISRPLPARFLYVALNESDNND